MTTPDLRTLAAEALLAAEPWVRHNPTEMLADAVLSAVLPAISDILLAKRDRLDAHPRHLGDRGSRSGGLEEAAGIVRRLAATTPPAEYHEAHRDDPEEWGEAMEPGKPRRRLASMISVRLSPDEVQQIREAAERVGESVSTFLRTAALDRTATTPPARQDSPGATGEATAVPEATERRSAGCDDCGEPWAS